MKRLISLLLVFVMTFALAGVASADGATPSFVISEAEAEPGEEVQVTISIANNPGIASAELDIQYDHNVLELTNIVDNTTTYPGLWNNKVDKDSFTYWAEGGRNNVQNDVLVTLTFAVKDDAAAGDYAVTATYDEDNVYDEDEENVYFGVTPGKVTVTGSEPAETPSFVISEAEAAPGEEVEVTISIANNPGIASAELDIQYDHNALELTNITDNTTTYPGLWNNKVDKDSFTYWAEGGRNNVQNDALVTLTFAVKDDAAAGDYAVTATYDEDNVYDEDEENVYFDVTPGKVTVTESEPAETPSFVISEAEAAPGEEVEVTISIANNPGIASAELDIQYDHDALELTNITDNTATYPGLWNNKPESDSFTYWAEGGRNNVQNDVLVTLTFTVKSDAAAGDYAVTVTYDEDNVYDEDEENVYFDITPGKVTVTEQETIADGYYLIGLNGWTVDSLTEEDMFAENENASGEYMIQKELAVGDNFKAVKVENGAIADNAWYPGGMDNNYVVDEDHAGNVTIYFRPDYSGGSDWHYSCLYIPVMPAFKSQSLLLEGDIGVRFYVYLPQSLRNSSTNVSFTISGKNGDNYASIVDFSEDMPTNSKGYYGFTFYVNTIQMADTITATLNYGDGAQLEKTYTVKEYFEAFDEAFEQHPEAYTDDIVNLIRATADLGHYMQAYLDESRTDWSVENGDHEAMDKSYTTYTQDDLDEATTAVADHALSVTGSSSNIKKLGYKVNFESKMSIHIIVMVKSGYTGALTATADGTDCTVTQQTATQFLVEIPNVQAHQLSHLYTIEITTESGTITLTGSALSYAYMMLAGAEVYNGSVVQDAAIAFYRYSKFADIVKGNPSDIDKVSGSNH